MGTPVQHRVRTQHQRLGRVAIQGDGGRGEAGIVLYISPSLLTYIILKRVYFSVYCVIILFMKRRAKRRVATSRVIRSRRRRYITRFYKRRDFNEKDVFLYEPGRFENNGWSCDCPRCDSYEWESKKRSILRKETRQLFSDIKKEYLRG